MSAAKIEFTELDRTIPLRVDAAVNPVIGGDYEGLSNKPSINGVELSGDKSAEELGLGRSALPDGGAAGDILTRGANNTAAWVTPAGDFTGDNSRPITAAAVQAQVGNIQALLEQI